MIIPKKYKETAHSTPSDFKINVLSYIHHCSRDYYFSKVSKSKSGKALGLKEKKLKAAIKDAIDSQISKTKIKQYLVSGKKYAELYAFENKS